MGRPNLSISCHGWVDVGVGGRNNESVSEGCVGWGGGNEWYVVVVVGGGVVDAE